MGALDADTEFWDTVSLVFISFIMSYLNEKKNEIFKQITHLWTCIF